MALDTCFQVSSIASTTTPSTTRASALHAHHLFYKEKLNLPATRGSKWAISPLSSSSPSSFTQLPLVRHRHQGTHFMCQAKHAVDAVQVATDANWNELVLGSETMVLVEFWAPWCGPCRMIAPVIEELAKELAGKIMCYQVNTDECPNIATEYGIRSIPTVLLFRNGEKKESIIGAVPKSTLSAAIEKYLQM